jgi:hypothetical protein
MRIDWSTYRSWAVFVAMVLAFILFGPHVGWRVVGVVALVGSTRALHEQRVGVGIEGYEPSFYLTGRPAIVASWLGILLALFLLLYPEAFI